jgi:drug/metabolite transporter (DMT)-like permease
MRRWAQDAPSRGMALGTQIAGGALLAPFIALSPPLAPPTPLVIVCVLALGVVCSAVAYILYFRLVTDIGPAGALTVTYLIPIFGVTWGALFLGETISLWMLGGGALVLLGTYLVLRR